MSVRAECVHWGSESLLLKEEEKGPSVGNIRTDPPGTTLKSSCDKITLFKAAHLGAFYVCVTGWVTTNQEEFKEPVSFFRERI